MTALTRLQLNLCEEDDKPHSTNLRRLQLTPSPLDTMGVFSGAISHLRRIHGYNVSTLRQAPFAEVSGALGDLGTLLPLMIALAIQKSIYLDATLVFSGLYNIVTGAVFGIPLPVQPMKVSEMHHPHPHSHSFIKEWPWLTRRDSYVCRPSRLLPSLTPATRRFRSSGLPDSG